MNRKAITLLFPCALLFSGLQANDPAFTFNSFGQSISEDFNTYRGTAATLPSDIFVGWDTGRISEPFQGVNTGAFTAYTSDEETYSFGIRERNPVDLRDARVFLPVKNNTGQPIRYFEVSYEVEAWFIGDRRNRLRMKFDRFLTPAESGGRATFEEDVFSTDNPSAELVVGTDVDGSLSQNRITVTGILDLENYSDGAGGFMGAIEPGDTAWFRWQFSNTSGDGGSLRSGLAFTNLVITPLESFTELEWKPGVGGDGTWEPVGGSNWSGDEWAQGAAAIFDGPAGVVTLDGAIEAFSLLMRSDYTLAAAPGASLASDTGVTVESGVTATLNAPIRVDSQLRKTGAGTLILGGEQNHTGNTTLAGGTLRAGADDVVSPNAPLVLSPGATFDLDGTTQTIGALIGERGGLVQLGAGGTLVIDTTSGSGFYRADLVGAGNLIKRGPGSQRFRSEKKTYTGFTRIEEGVLEVTGNGEMTGTSAIEVMPEGELFFVGDSSSGPPADFGAPISLMGGRLAFQNTGDEALYFVDTEVQIIEDGSTINVSGAESIAIFDAGFGGEVTGAAQFRKTGAGIMEIEGNHSHNGGIEVRNGSVALLSGSSLGAGPLHFTTSSNRSLVLQNNGLTVTLLDGDATDPEEPEAENNLTLNIVNAGATFTVNQPILLDEADEEVSTRFQGAIVGAGDFVKDGDGFLRLTRWAKTYTGSTTVNQGVLAVSASAALSDTSEITVASGGQLRLTTSGPEVAYNFGGDLNLAGGGRSGDVTLASGQGILGALRYEPGNEENTATLANGIVFDSGDGVALHVSGSSNTLILEGDLSGDGVDAISKSGGGVLRLHAENAGLNKPWMIANGTLDIAAGASSGSGSIEVGESAVLSGRGTVGASVSVSGSLDMGSTPGALTVSGGLNLASSGRLLLTLPTSNPRLLMTGAALVSAGASIDLEGAVEAGTYPVFTANGGLSGDALTVNGLSEGLSASLDFDAGTDTLLLVVSGTAAITFSGWIDDFALAPEDQGPLATPAGDGVTNLIKYALGIAPLSQVASALPSTDLITIDGDTYLALEVVTRSDDSGLEIEAEGSGDLIDWTLPLVEVLDVDQSGVAPGFERRAWRTADPVANGSAFLRIRATLDN